MVGPVDQGAGAAGELEQRPECRQLAAAVQQFLNAGVDDVSQVVAGARRLDARPRRHAACLAVVAGHADETAHQGHKPDAVAGVVVAGHLSFGASQAGGCGDVGDKGRGHVGEADGVAEALERLEQHQQREARAGLARALPREGEFSRLRRERLQLGRPRLGGQARVGGVGDDRHERCRPP